MTRSRKVHDTPYAPPTPPTERSVVAELYYQSRLAGLHPTLEVSFEMPTSFRTYRDTRRVFRADLGLVVDQYIIALVEVKRTKPKILPKPTSMIGQPKLYREIGLPWRYCFGMDEIPETVAWLTNFV